MLTRVEPASAQDQAQVTTAYGANRSWIILSDDAVRRVSHALLLESTAGVDRRNV